MTGATAYDAGTERSVRRRQVLSSSATLVAAQLLIAVAGVISSRQLGPSGRGVVTGVLAWGQTIPLFAVAGLNSALLVRVAQSPSGNVGEALGNALAYTLVVGGTIAVAAVLLVPGVVANLGGPSRPLAIVAMITIPFALLNELLFAMNVALGRIRWNNASRLASPVIVFCGTIVLLLTGAITTTSVVVLTVASGVLTTFAAAAGLPWRELALAARTLREDVTFGLKVAGAGWMGYANLRLDILVMSAFVAASQVGYYGVANNAMIPVTSIAAAAAGLLTPAVARLADTSTPAAHLVEQQASLITADLRRYGLMAGGGGILLAVAAPFFVPLLFGSAFRPAVSLIWILIPGYVARACVSVIVAGAVGMRAPRVGNIAEAVALAVTVTLLPLLLGPLEAVGAAITSTAAYIVAGVVAFVLLRRLRLADGTRIVASM